MSSTLRRVIALSLAALAAVAVTSCTSTSPSNSSDDSPAPTSSASASTKSNYPFTIENCGRTYTYTQVPQQVVVGWPTTVDTLTALGVGSTVTGYISSKFGPAPQGVNAKVLSADYAPSAEAILNAQPDFFLANGDSQLDGSRGGVTSADLSKIGANTYVMGDNCKDSKGGTTVDTVYQDITNLGRIFDVPDKAAVLISTLRARVAAAAGLRGNAGVPRIAYVNVTSGKLYALSGLSYAAQVDGVGAVNVFADLQESFSEISPEKVLTLNADAIVFEYYINTETADQQKSEIVQRLGNSKAVRDGKVIGVPDYLSEGPGLAAIEAIELIAKGLYA
jgi:iron complex transport system substrate-binding protein